MPDPIPVPDDARAAAEAKAFDDWWKREVEIMPAIDTFYHRCLAKAGVQVGFLAGYSAGREAAAVAAWDAINSAMPDGSWHDAQEVVNTAIRAKGAGK